LYQIEIEEEKKTKKGGDQERSPDNKPVEPLEKEFLLFINVTVQAQRHRGTEAQR